MIGALLTKRALANSFDALNRHDLAGFMSAWREDGVWIYPGDIAASGTFEGKSAIESWFRRFLEQFPRIQFEIQSISVANIFDLVGNNRAAVHWTICLTNQDGHQCENSGVTLVQIRGGQAARGQDFLFDLGEEFKRAWGAE